MGWGLRRWAGFVKRDIHALYLAGRDRRVSWYVKGLAILLAAYAVSPIDLIPDFIPLVGYLDDLVLLPLGIYFVVKLIPAEIMDECRAQAATAAGKPVSRAAAAVIILLWVVTLVLAARFYLSSSPS